MKTIQNYSTLLDTIQQETVLLVYCASKDCAVCQADEPRVDALCQQLHFPAVRMDAEEVPEAAGQLNLFSLPAVLLFDHKKEYHRQSRILDFDQLEQRMKELSGEYL